MDGESLTQTAYAIRCPRHGKVYLTKTEYDRQMSRPDARWSCPRMDADMLHLGLCGAVSSFDDDNYEKVIGEES